MPVIYLWSSGILIVFVLISAVFKKKRFSRLFARIGIGVFLLLVLEIVSLIGLRIRTGEWYFRQKINPNSELFRPHPYLVGVPIPSASMEMEGIRYSHNSSGFRGKEIKKSRNQIRIIAIGGSTTYGVGVNDDQTWPFYLDSLLGDEYEVLNFGIPGHSTVENIILSDFIVPEYEPDIVLIHVGENDLRNLNIKGLTPDYSNYHAPSLHGALGFCYQNNLPRIALVKVAVLLMQKAGIYPVCDYHKMKISESQNDSSREYAKHLFKRNLSTLVDIYSQRNVKTILIPQVLAGESVKGGKMKWWIPYITDEDLIKYIDVYNSIMSDIAVETSTVFVNEAVNNNWSQDDFIDACHLCADGNFKIAKMIKQEINSIDSLFTVEEALNR